MKITFKEYVQLLENSSTRKKALRDYSIFVPSDDLVQFQIEPDPKSVEFIPFQKSLGAGLNSPNDILRKERQGRFERDIAAFPDRPVLLVEGDSWVHFPYIIDDILQAMFGHFNICAVGAAGDRNSNMIRGGERERQKEYLLYLRQLKAQGTPANAFFFSGAGNDIVGEIGGRALITDLLKDSVPGGNAKDHIVEEKFNAALDQIEEDYVKLITEVHAESGYEQLPIFIHGYAHNFPHPHGPKEKRKKQCYQSRGVDQWLGVAFKAHRIDDYKLKHDIMIYLIDSLYERMAKIAAANASVYVLDGRCYKGRYGQDDCKLFGLSDWKDEIHLRSKAFRKLSKKFRNEIKAAV